MSAMQQIYATHCTFGTSAIERREGEMAERVLGYSARSSSFSPADLRKHFRTFERYLSYNLWSDAPAELRTTLVAATAPKRLVFMPSVSGFQMLGHVAYRTWDTTGKRAGSYFAHLVVAERGKDEAPWSILDCLRLWNAPGWHVEDSPTFSYDLPPLNSLAGLWAAPPERAYEDAFEPVIGDVFLLRFLTEDNLADGPGATFLPSRWLAMPASRRLEMFRQALRGYLHVAGQGRDNAVLVAEPEVAALFFYGIARLLPDGELRQSISFSTFEGNIDRPATQLIGTHFHDPFKTDLRPDRYQRGFALNTYLEGKATELRNPHPYAEMILERLATDGWRGVDAVFDAFQAGLGRTVADLGELVRAGELAERFLDPVAKPDIAALDRNDFARRYVGKSLSATLAGPAVETVLRPLVDTPDQRAIVLLKLLAGGPHAAACDSSLRFLREHLPESQLPRFLELSEIPLESKTRTLVRFVDQERRLPAGLEDLFDIAMNAARVIPRNVRDQQLAALSAPLLRDLRSDTVRNLADNLPAAMHTAFFVELAAAVGPADDKQKWLRRMVIKGGNMSDESLSLAIERLSDRLDLLMPETRKEIGYRFIQVLNSIQRSPAEFVLRLGQLRRVKRLIETMEDFQRDAGDLGPSWLPIDRLNAWERVPEVIKQARLKSQEKKTGWAALRGEGANDLQYRVGEQMAKALSHALPHNELRSEVSSQDKAVMMHNIIVALGGGDLLAPDWKTRAAYYLEYNHWYDTAAPVSRKSDSARRPWMFFGVGAAIATLLGTVLLFAFFGGGSRPPAPPPGKQQVAQSKAKTRPAKKDEKQANQAAAGALTVGPTRPTATESGDKSSRTTSPNSVMAADSNANESPATSETTTQSKDPSSPVNASANGPSNPAAASDVPSVPPPGADIPRTPSDTTAQAKPAPMMPAKTGVTAATIKLEASPDDTAKPNATPAVTVKPPEPAPPPASERNFEVAELPLPAKSDLIELLSSNAKPLDETNASPDIEWVMWQDANAKGVSHTLRIHGLNFAKSQWSNVSVAPVTTPDKYVLRATHDGGMLTDLMEFRMPVSTGTLTMRVPGLDPARKELVEIQRQLFFCVLELQSETGSRYVALHPPRDAEKIPMSSSDDLCGLIQGKNNQPSMAPRPLDQRLQRLWITGGMLRMKDKRVYVFGEPFGTWLGAESVEWELRPGTTTQIGRAHV